MYLSFNYTSFFFCGGIPPSNEFDLFDVFIKVQDRRLEVTIAWLTMRNSLSPPISLSILGALSQSGGALTKFINFEIHRITCLFFR